jgi:hypothetical protein
MDGLQKDRGCNAINSTSALIRDREFHASASEFLLPRFNEVLVFAIQRPPRTLC